MAFEISVGPAQLTLNIGESVLITESDGQIHQPSERGLFYRDTRLVSEWLITGNGVPWTLLSSAATAHFAGQVVMTNPALTSEGGDIKAGMIALTLSRLLGLGGMRETITLSNYNRRSVRIVLAITLRCDFADIFDVKSKKLVDRGRTDTSFVPEEGSLSTIHTNETFRRGLVVGPDAGAPRPGFANGALVFTADLPAQGSWTADLVYRMIDGDTVQEPPASAYRDTRQSAEQVALNHWRSEAMQLQTPHPGLQGIFDQSVDDLAALRLPIEGTDLTSFVPAAGIPWFAALFGRDTLITAVQTTAVYPDFARGALEVLARHQSEGTDDSRDMQPDKIMHELREGELAQLGLVPYRPYYGTADATPLYIILLHRTWRLTGDRSLLDQHLRTAERCLDWIDRSGDMDGDGFQEYQRRTPQGAENQGWKDSGNAILDEEGDDVPAPKALCELQGYVYDAWRRMAGIYDALGRERDAATMRGKADDLYARFNATFWDEATGAYALCLDPSKRRVMTNASNPGQLLWSGIVPPERAERVVRRLMAPDMWTGWGIRTLSADHPGYNPLDYQLGAVWPHDNGFIALGFAQYGFHDEAAAVAKGLIDAGCRFQFNRLPEVFSGLDRKAYPFPVQYLGANVPQAWAAGSVFSLLQALLGLTMDVGTRTIYTDPHLPDWLPELKVTNFRIGKARVALRAWRENDATRVAILDGEGVRLEHRPFGKAFEF